MATCASDSCSASVPLQSIIPRRASVETLSGYTCSFVREPDASFSCPVCARVLRQPQLTDCCGNHFCTSCLSRWLETSSSCPLCRQVGFRSIKDKKMERALHDLEVRKHSVVSMVRRREQGRNVRNDVHLSPYIKLSISPCLYRCTVIWRALAVCGPGSCVMWTPIWPLTALAFSQSAPMAVET